jgi:putative chitinase
MSNPVNISASLLTGEKLKKIAPSLTLVRANQLSDSIAKICSVYGIYDKQVLPSFLSQVIHESNEFKDKTENLNYSATALVKTWPTRFVLKAHSAGSKLRIAENYAYKPKDIANASYNGRMGNNVGSDDGWNFRGSGFMQMTGKDAFRPYFDYKLHGHGYKFPMLPSTLEQLVDKIRTDDEWALDSACWEFAISKGLLDEARRGDMLTITKRINGGTLGLESRMSYYRKAMSVLA